MISAKVQIDTILKSNNIIVFLNDADEVSATKKAEKINLINNRNTKLNNSTTRTKLAENKSNTLLSSSDIVKLLELYGIQKKSITLIPINQLKSPKICEMYLKAYYCNNQDVKYPLVFMHGIFFGSNDEILLAHNEGFLFELFKDTGMYNMSLDVLMNNDYENEDYDDYEEGDSIDDEYINDDEDAFAIDRVAKFNIKKLNTSKKSKLSQSKRTWESLNDCNSDYSSLYSVNKQSYCQNYIDNNTEQSTKCKNSLSEVKNKSLNDDSDSSSEFNRKVTPPGEILATINKWALKTKEAIEKRNKQIIKKKNF